MALSHTNTIQYKYKAGGVTTNKTVEVTESASAEINVSETITFVTAYNGTQKYDLSGFEFETASSAVSTYFEVDGTNAAIWKNGHSSEGGTKMLDVDDAVPYVWSKNSGTSHPTGTSNQLLDGTTKLTIIPHPYDETTNPKHADGNTATITIRVLYNVEPS
tara:strand:+ start:1419 stop:1901 length:483 start_codon:yes stop_codon:yes gene_type:complete